MPSERHGQGASTIDKERRIGAFLGVTMKIVANKFSGLGYSYWHFDTNAGSGYNDVVRAPGSPLVFLSLAEMYLSGIPPHAFFAEREPHRASELLENIQSSKYANRCYVFPADNKEVIHVFAERIRQSGERSKYVMGTIVIDPNGWFYRSAKGNGAPIEELKQFFIEFPRIDVVLNLNQRTYQLQKGQKHIIMSATEIMGFLNKQYWFLGRGQNGHSRFLLMLGRNNVDIGQQKTLGIHKLGTPAANEILEWIETGRQGRLL